MGGGGPSSVYLSTLSLGGDARIESRPWEVESVPFVVTCGAISAVVVIRSINLPAVRGVKLINLTLWPLLGASVSRVTHTHLRYSPMSDVTAGMRIDCVSPIRPLCGIYKSAPRWRESANDGSKTSCALPHRSRGQVSVGFH